MRGLRTALVALLVLAVVPADGAEPMSAVPLERIARSYATAIGEAVGRADAYAIAPSRRNQAATLWSRTVAALALASESRADVLRRFDKVRRRHADEDDIRADCASIAPTLDSQTRMLTDALASSDGPEAPLRAAWIETRREALARTMQVEMENAGSAIGSARRCHADTETEFWARNKVFGRLYDADLGSERETALIGAFERAHHEARAIPWPCDRVRETLREIAR